MVVEVVQVEGWVVCDVDIGHKSTSTGNGSIDPLDCLRVEIGPGQDGGDDDFGGGESLSGSLCHSPHRLCHSLLLFPQVVSACVHYYVTWFTQVFFGE